MDAQNYLSEEEKKNLLKGVNLSKEEEKKAKNILDLDKKIRELLKKSKISEHSLQVILQILSGLRINIMIQNLPEEDRLHLNMEKSGFKSNADFRYAKDMSEIEEIKETNIKKEMEKIAKEIKKINIEFEKEIKKLQEEKKIYGCKLICPYCESEYIKEFGTDRNNAKEEFVEQCPNCSKEYKVLSGKVTLWRGRGTGVVSYGLPEYTIRIKNEDGERMMIFNTKYNLLHIKTGDSVYFTFKKKFLSSSFSDKPASIINANTNTYSLI